MTDKERIAELEQALESCLGWAGDLQRRCDALEASKAVRLARAFGAARGLGDWLRLPGRAWSILRAPTPSTDAESPQRPELSLDEIPRGKPIVAVVLPWLAAGGAEKVVLDMLRGLRDEFTFVVIAAERGRHERREAFLEATPWIYHREGLEALERFLPALDPDGIVISATRVGYEALPALDGLAGWHADILHNIAPEGCLAASLEHDVRLDLHFCVGRLQADAYARAGVDQSKIVVVPNTVDAEGRFDPARYDSPARDRPRVGVVARLSEEKGVGLFIDAFALVQKPRPQVEGVIWGDGPERIRLERRIRRLGLTDSLRIAGFTTRVPEALAELDLVVLPSRVEGASPNAVLEAMAMERYVIAADVAGVGEAIEDGVNGRLVAERTPEAFAAAIFEALDDEERRRRVAAAARGTALERFRPGPVLDAYREAIRRGVKAARTL